MRGFLALLAIAIFVLLWSPHQAIGPSTDMAGNMAGLAHDCAGCPEMGAESCAAGMICGVGVVLVNVFRSPVTHAVGVALPVWRGVPLSGSGPGPGVPPPKPVFFA